MRVRSLGVVAGTLLAGALVTAASALHWLAPVEAFAHDLLLRLVPERAARHAVVVAIDERSLRDHGPWPWPRERVAALVERAAGAGVTAVGLDLLLAEERPGDARLAAACRRVRCVTAAALDERGNWILPAATLQSAILPGHAAFELDDDGILRRIFTTKQDAHRSVPAFAVQLAGPATIVSGREIVPGFRTPPRALPVISASDLLAGSSPVALRGRIAVVGVTALALGDRVMTARTRRHARNAGVLVHAAALESILEGDLLGEASPITSGAMAAVLVAIALLVARQNDTARRMAAEAILIALPFVLAAALVFGRVFVPAVALSAAVAVAVLATELRGSLQTTERLEGLAREIVRRRAGDAESRRVLAHELKTPLTAMRNLSQLLAGYELTPAERQRLALLLSDEAERLQEMVTGLLEIERLALRTGAEGATIVELGDVVSARVALLAQGTVRRIEYAVSPEVAVLGDRSLLAEVVDNLIGNALKFTPPGSPIAVEVRREDGEALIEVMDRGPGVAPSERERIFTAFARGSAAAGTDGLGLGLALVAEAVRWHDGSVEVGEREGGGAIFRVRIPAVAAGVIAEAV